MHGDQLELRLSRLRIVHQPDDGWPAGSDVLIPGVLLAQTAHGVAVLHCSDTVALIASLWSGRAYTARGQLLMPVPEPGETMRVDLSWPNGATTLFRTPLPRWKATLSVLAGQVADVATVNGEREVLGALAPALAGL